MPLCTKSNPMPATRDQMGQHWVHQSVREVTPGYVHGHNPQYECLACGHILYGRPSTLRVDGASHA